MCPDVGPDACGCSGWRSLLIHGDPCVLDRWLWVRRRLRGKEPLRTLDAGCGNGAFSIYAAREGNAGCWRRPSSEREGYRTRRRRARLLGVEGIDFRVLDLRAIEPRREELGSFDQIICLETIEHLSDDEAAVASLARLLRPGGQLLISTPFDGHRPLYSEPPEPSATEDGSHVRFEVLARATARELVVHARDCAPRRGGFHQRRRVPAPDEPHAAGLTVRFGLAAGDGR